MYFREDRCFYLSNLNISGWASFWTILSMLPGITISDPYLDIGTLTGWYQKSTMYFRDVYFRDHRGVLPWPQGCTSVTKGVYFRDENSVNQTFEFRQSSNYDRCPRIMRYAFYHVSLEYLLFWELILLICHGSTSGNSSVTESTFGINLLSAIRFLTISLIKAFSLRIRLWKMN